VDTSEIADKLHSAAIHLLRRLRAEDSESGLSAPRLSALSVVVFAGPLALSELAAAEQVRLPTISRLIKDLEQEGMVRRLKSGDDARVQRVEATAKGKKLLQEGRRRRVARLAADLGALTAAERTRLGEAAELMERLSGAPRTR
jgi:DNA-binding MarR family transcriptional regulator